jgi:hypothetical protein
MGLFSSGKSALKRLKQEAQDTQQRQGTGKTGQPPQQAVGQPGQQIEGRLALPQRTAQQRPFTRPHAEMLDITRLLKAIQGQLGAPFQMAEGGARAGQDPVTPAGDGMLDTLSLLEQLSQGENRGTGVLGAGGGGAGGGGGGGGFGGQGGGNILRELMQLG